MTRSASNESLGTDVVQQFANSNALMSVAGLLLLLGLLPGLPKLPFLGLGAIIAGGGLLVRRRRGAARVAEAELEPAIEGRALGVLETPTDLLQVDPMEIEIGFGLIPLVDETRADNLLNRVTNIRRQLVLDLGFILPKVRIRDNLRLPPHRYRLRLRGAEVGHGDLMLNRHLAMPTRPDAPPIEGIEAVEPAFGLPAWWVDEDTRDEAEMSGYTVVDPLSVLVTHMSEVIKSHAPQLLGLQDVQDLLDNLRKTYPAAVEGVVPDRLSLSEFQQVLRNLLRERVPIRDLLTIVETVSRYAGESRDPNVLGELSRRALSYTISDQHAVEGVLHVATLDPATEALVVQSVQGSQHLGLDPQTAQALLTQIGEAMEQLAKLGHQPVLLCSAEVRLPLARLAERSLPSLTLISYNEVSPHVEVQAHAVVALE